MSRVLGVILVLLLAGAGALYYLFSQDISKARASVTGRSQTIDTTFGKLEYAEAGSGEPLLSIHGSGGGFDQGLDMVRGLAEDYRLIAPSRFGYLGSAYPENPTIAMQADAFAELLDRLAIEDVVILGGSAGALSAMEFAIRHPERCRALVLLVPTAFAPTRRPGTSGAEGPVMVAIMKTVLGSDFLFWAGRRFFPDLMTRMLLATDPALVHAADAAEQARVGVLLDHILPVSARAQGLMFDMKTAGSPEPQAIDRITCPVLAISAIDDMFGTSDPAKYVAEHVARGRAVIHPTGGHVGVGRQDDIAREISDFLSSIDNETVSSRRVLSARVR